MSTEALDSARVTAAREAVQGQLELTWTNKHKRLLDRLDGSYEWVERSDWRVMEVRLLRDLDAYGETSPRSRRIEDNLAIHGDALAALRALTELPEFARQYRGRVRVAYVDPPFNTGQTFEDYDDALEHSVWLTMFRDRLEQIRRLLSSDGSVWVHLDDQEVHRARCVMDEVFGAKNFVATIAWEKADSPRNSARQFSVDQDYILVYSRQPEWTPNRLPRTEQSDAIYQNPDDDPRGAWYPGDPFANKPYSKGQYAVTGPTGRRFEPPPGRYWRISEDRFWQLDADGRVWWGGEGSARPSLKRYLADVADLVPRTIWSKDDVGSNRTSKNEMRTLFPKETSFATPKPERLLERIVHLASDPGDIVLDCFAGSGTTAAVAHKMLRRWVAVEREHATFHSVLVERLRKVVGGTDPGGVTESTGWRGGGGFRALGVAPSMFQADEAGRVWLADWASNGELAEATAAQLDYEYSPEGPFVGRRGRTRLAVVDGLVNEAVLRVLGNSLAPGEAMEVAGTAKTPDAAAIAREISPGSRVRQVPREILAKWRRAQGASL